MIGAPWRDVPNRFDSTLELTVEDSVGPSADAARYDVVAVLARRSTHGAKRPSESDPIALAHRLAPNGQLYLEVDRPGILARPRRLRHQLEQAGLADVHAYWPVRGFERPDLFVPLTDRVAQGHYVDQLMWGGSRARRLVRSVLRGLIRLRLFDAAVPRYIVLATSRRPDPAQEADDLGILDAVGAGWPTIVGSDQRPAAIRWLVQAGGPSVFGKVVCSAWFGRSATPSAVVKIARTPGSNASVHRGHEALGVLLTLGTHPTIAVPRPLGTAVVYGREVAVETPVAGRTMVAHMAERSPSVSAVDDRWAGWIDWLADLHASSSQLASRDDLETHVHKPLRQAIEELRLSPDEATVLERLASEADGSAGRHPLKLVFAHNDLGPSNVLVSAIGDPVGVIDWESAGPGLPAMDLIYFLGRLADEIAQARHPVRGWDFKTAFFDRGCVATDVPGAMTRRWLDRYASRIDLATEWLPILFVSCWTMHALNERRRSIASEGPTTTTVGFFERRLGRSLQMLERLNLTTETL
jgi:aminoglycoside phosphotransferase (APT) family kinase protein